MNYTPNNPPDNPAALPGFLRQELANLREALLGTADSVMLRTLYAEPSRKREGMIVKAASPWNPGSGDGIYAYVSGAWVKL